MNLELATTNKYGHPVDSCKYQTVEDIVEDFKILVAEGTPCYVYSHFLDRCLLEYIDGEINDPLDLLQ